MKYSFKMVKHKQVVDINMVPYLDVLLVLLVIFMVTVPIFQQGIQVDLPKATAKKLPAEKNKSIMIGLDRRGRYHLIENDKDQVILSKTKLMDRIKSMINERHQKGLLDQVYIQADKQLYYGDVLSLMDELQHVGVTKVALVTQPYDSNAVPSLEHI